MVKKIKICLVFKCLFCLMLIVIKQDIFAQQCLDSLKDKSIIMLKNEHSTRKFVTIKNNKSDFILLSAKSVKTNVQYINSFSSKYVCIWNEKKFMRNKRSIIACGVIGGILTIPTLAMAKKLDRSAREPLGSVLVTMSLAPIAGAFDITSIGMGIKRAVVIKKSKKRLLFCNF